MIHAPIIPRTTKDRWRAIVLDMLAEGGATVTTLPSGLHRITTKHGDSITCTDMANFGEREILKLTHRSF